MVNEAEIYDAMILVFGGTTEGRRATEVLEEAGSPYYYSTKTGEQDITLHHGIRVDGEMDGEAMYSFCQQRQIRLMVDAAHPFASQLHETVAKTAELLQIPVVRYERVYPPHDPDITWIDDYSQVPTDILSLLAATGVQSIGKLKYLETKGVKVVYRILNRASSIALAHQQGATDDQLCYYPESAEAEAMLLKESGISGGFAKKVSEAREKGMRIIVIKRPQQAFANSVNGPHGLRRAVEHLLPAFFPLHSGLTTGTCATAAAIAATIKLTRGDMPTEVPVVLPNGETIQVGVGYRDDYAYCIKEAGDDPDITDGIEIRAESQPGPTLNGGEWLAIKGGNGVGRFTLPGFDYPPGSPAINKGPREMIRNNLERIIPPLHSGEERGWVCTISVPHGEETARRTFNPRLGIEGGISIIGVSGIVKPFSEEAFIDSIRKCVTVALASGTKRIVINSGGKSEGFLRCHYPELPAQAFVQYGNYIGETLKIIASLTEGQPRYEVTLGVMLGKAVKLAAGHLDTHSRKTVMDIGFIRQMLVETGCDIDISDMTLARELWERLPEDKRQKFACTVIRHCLDCCKPLLPNGKLTILLIDDNGKIFSTTN